MALEFLDQPYVYGNARGFNELARRFSEAYSRQCEMVVFGSSLQSANFGFGQNWYQAFIGEIIQTYGHLAGTQWSTPQAAIDVGALSVTNGGNNGAFTISLNVESSKSTFPPSIGIRENTGNDYIIGALAGSAFTSDEGIRVSLRSPAADNSNGTARWDYPNIYANLTPETWEPVDVSTAGASLDVLTANYPGKTGVTMEAELRPLDPDIGYDPNAKADGRFNPDMATLRNEQAIDLSGEDGPVGSGFTKHTFDFAPLADYSAGDAGRIYNVRLHATPGTSSVGAAAIGVRWRSRVEKSWCVTPLGIGGVDLDYVAIAHPDSRDSLTTMVDADVIYTSTGQNDLANTRDDFRSNVNNWYGLVNNIWPSAVIVIGLDPTSEGHITLQSNDGDNYFTDLMAMVDSVNRPMVALNVRRVLHERGLADGGALDPDDGNGDWMADATHPNLSGSIAKAQAEWSLMLAAASNRPRIYKRVGIR